MARRAPAAQKKRPKARFDAQRFLDSAGVERRIATYRAGTTVFSQGDPASTVLYIQQGAVKLSVLSDTGKEAVVAMLGPGDFFGEGCLAGQSQRMGTATSLAVSSLLIIAKRRMLQVLHDEPALSNRFISHMLTRNIRIEEDLIDQLLNSSEKRLARTLLLLARYGRNNKPQRVVPRVSQELLAEMVGTTRSRVNYFMNKFRKLGFIEYNGELKINNSLLTVVLHD